MTARRASIAAAWTVLLLFNPVNVRAQVPAPTTPLWMTGSHPPAGQAPAATSGLPLSETRDGEVRDMVLKGDSIDVRYKNTGTMATAIIGEIQVRDEAGELVAAVLLADSLTVRAGATQRFRAAMPQLPKGHYTLYAVFDFGGDTMTAAEAPLEIR